MAARCISCTESVGTILQVKYQKMVISKNMKKSSTSKTIAKTFEFIEISIWTAVIAVVVMTRKGGKIWTRVGLLEKPLWFI